MADPSDKFDDPFAPPQASVKVQCLHCGQSYDSWQIVWREEERDALFQGYWCCPTDGCTGVGFGFDILPVDDVIWDEDDDDDEDWADGDLEFDDEMPMNDLDCLGVGDDALWPTDPGLGRPRPLGNTPLPEFDPRNKPVADDEMPF
jgi:hypothetical protein